MPPVRSINLDNGIDILTSFGVNFQMPKVNIQGRLAGVAGNLKKKEAKFNERLQIQPAFATIIALADLPPDDRALQEPPALLPYEYIDGDDFVSIKMYVEVHIYDDSPLSFNIRIQNKQAGPIMGEWWQYGFDFP